MPWFLYKLNKTTTTKLLFDQTMSAEPLPKKKKKKKKKKKETSTTPRLQSPANSLSPNNHYEGTSNEPDGAPSFLGDHITNPGPRLIQHILATKIQLFKLDIAKREKIDLGKKVVAIIPENKTLFNIIVYESKNRRLILSIPIDNRFNLGVLGPTSISFNDNKSGDLYSFTFLDSDMLYEFICSCCMVKIFGDDINTDNHGMIIQDLNNANNSPLCVNQDTSICNTLLKIWTANKKQHPYKRGKLIYKGDKSIYLKTGKWIMPAIIDTLKGMRVGLKRLIIVPPQFGFGENGNDKLNVRKNSTLIIEIELKSIEQSKIIQYGSDQSMINMVREEYKSNGNNNNIGKGGGVNGKQNAIQLNQLKKENTTLKQEILRLNARINDLVKENEKLKKSVDYHQIEQVKEKTNLRKAIKAESKKLENNLNFDGFSGSKQWESYDLDIDYTKKHYLEWNSSDVIDWVLSLNYGSFAKYSSLIRKNIPKQNIKGKHLSKLDKSEWKSLGILDYDDCLSIVDHVKALTSSEKKQFANNFDNFANNFDPNINLFD